MNAMDQTQKTVPNGEVSMKKVKFSSLKPGAFFLLQNGSKILYQRFGVCLSQQVSGRHIGRVRSFDNNNTFVTPVNARIVIDG
jgi:hypothetical protein